MNINIDEKYKEIVCEKKLRQLKRAVNNNIKEFSKITVEVIIKDDRGEEIYWIQRIDINKNGMNCRESNHSEEEIRKIY